MNTLTLYSPTRYRLIRRSQSRDSGFTLASQKVFAVTREYSMRFIAI